MKYVLRYLSMVVLIAGLHICMQSFSFEVAAIAAFGIIIVNQIERREGVDEYQERIVKLEKENTEHLDARVEAEQTLLQEEFRTSDANKRIEELRAALA